MTSTSGELKTTTPRRNRDAEVMAHAIAVISERGYPATTVQDVADRVGVLKGSLYHYLSSKEDLLFRILDSSFSNAEAKFVEMKKLQLSPGQELITYLRTASETYLADPQRANIFFTEARHLTGENRANIRSRSEAWFDYILDLVRRAVATGEATSPVAPVLMTRYIIGALNSVRTWFRGGNMADDDAARMADSFIELSTAVLGLSIPESQLPSLREEPALGASVQERVGAIHLVPAFPAGAASSDLATTAIESFNWQLRH